MEKFEVTDNKRTHRFEVTESGKLAFLQYKISETIISLLHTEVPENLSGRGIATSLAEYAFAFAFEHSLGVKNYCAFVESYLKKHPELNHMVQQSDKT